MKDIIIDDDITITDGDLFVDASEQQHIEHILRAKKGQFYQYPTLGVGIEDNINGNIDRNILLNEIRQNLEADNFKVNEIDISDDFEILIDAE